MIKTRVWICLLGGLLLASLALLLWPQEGPARQKFAPTAFWCAGFPWHRTRALPWTAHTEATPLPSRMEPSP